MGCKRRASYNHLQRLQAEGLISRVAMTRGEGSLFVVTNDGASVAGQVASGAPRSLSPSTWAHTVACAWVSAWLEVRQRPWHSTREVAQDAEHASTVSYRDTRGQTRSVTHRPDLATVAEDRAVAIEVELQRKTLARLRGILAMYGQRCSPTAGSAPLRGVLYITGSPDVAQSVTRAAQDIDMPQGVLRLRALDDVIAETRAARG